MGQQVSSSKPTCIGKAQSGLVQAPGGTGTGVVPVVPLEPAEPAVGAPPVMPPLGSAPLRPQLGTALQVPAQSSQRTGVVLGGALGSIGSGAPPDCEQTQPGVPGMHAWQEI